MTLVAAHCWKMDILHCDGSLHKDGYITYLFINHLRHYWFKKLNLFVILYFLGCATM